MDVPQAQVNILPQVSIKQDVDSLTFATESNVDYDSETLDLMEIKVEPGFYKSESNYLEQELKLSEEAKIIEYKDEHMLNSHINTLNEKSKQKELQIKVEQSEEMEETEKMKDIADVKCEINNKKLNIKDELNINDEEQGNTSRLDSRQQQRKTRTASGSKKKINENNYFSCKQCKYKTIYKVRFDRHVATHIRPYKCVRDYQTVNKQDLKTHIVKHKSSNEVDMYKCDQCDYQTVCKDSLKKHILRHKSPNEVDMYECDECGFQTVYKDSFKRHILLHKSPHEVEMYKCDQCELQTIHKRYLKTHSLIHKSSDEVNMFKCDQCDFQTLRKDSLKKHIVRHKSPDEVDMYECDQCEFQTVHKDSFKRHILLHKSPHEVDMYKCDQCKFQTIHKGSLKIHIVAKISCPGAFANIDNICIARRVNLGNRAYKNNLGGRSRNTRYCKTATCTRKEQKTWRT